MGKIFPEICWYCRTKLKTHTDRWLHKNLDFLTTAAHQAVAVKYFWCKNVFYLYEKTHFFLPLLIFLRKLIFDKFPSSKSNMFFGLCSCWMVQKCLKNLFGWWLLFPGAASNQTRDISTLPVWNFSTSRLALLGLIHAPSDAILASFIPFFAQLVKYGGVGKVCLIPGTMTVSQVVSQDPLWKNRTTWA